MPKSQSLQKILRKCSMAAGPFPPSARRCTWCGGGLTGRQRKWCSQKCNDTAVKNHYYRVGRVRALRRDRFTCQHCGDRGPGMQVNHIEPCLGKHSLGGCWHHLENLEAICPSCHQGVTRRQRENGDI
jgi:5-methylcytosine-specific restriction endonuclease McrA